MRAYALHTYLFRLGVLVAMMAAPAACQTGAGEPGEGEGASDALSPGDDEGGDQPAGPVAKARASYMWVGGEPGGAPAGTPVAPLSGPDGGSAALPPLVTMAAACEMNAAGVCQRWFTCAPGLARNRFGADDFDACKQRLRLTCLADAVAADSGLTTVAAVACAHAHETVSCADLVNRRAPAACRLTGRRVTGKACGVGAQCESGYCSFAGGRCGMCAPRGGVGTDCAAGGDDSCLLGLFCGASATCVRPGAIGAACDKELPCEAQLSCASGRCVAPLPPASACKETGQCDLAQGQICLPLDASKAAAGSVLTCRPAPLAAAGEICGEAAVITHLCPGGVDNCRASGKGDWRCLLPLEAGATCDGTNAEPGCTFPSRCTDNQCRLYSADGC